MGGDDGIDAGDVTELGEKAVKQSAGHHEDVADAFLLERTEDELDGVGWLAHRVFPSWAAVGLRPSLTASAVRTPDSMAPSIQACLSEVCSPAK